MQTIDITDIRKRKAILAESSEVTNNINISNAYERAKSYKYEDIRSFVKECGKNKHNANEYIKPCIEFVEALDKPELVSIFKSEVLPRVNDYELKYVYESYSSSPKIAKYIHEQMVKNKVADRVIANHDNIMKKLDTEELFKAKEMTTESKITSLCQVIDSFVDIPPYAKVNITLEESAYLIARFLDDSKYNPLNTVIEYYCISHDLTSKDIKQINDVLKENYLVEDIRTIKDTNSIIKDLLDRYISRTEHNPFELNLINSKILKASEADWIRNANEYWKLMQYIAIYGATEDIKINLISYLSTEFPKALVDRFSTSPMFKDVLKANIDAIKYIQEVVTDLQSRMGGSNETFYTDCDNLIHCLNGVLEDLNYVYNISYTKENVEYITGESILTENVIADRMTLYEFKDRKFDPLIVKFGKFDKMLQREIRYWAKKTKDNVVNTVQDAMKKVEDKMYEEASIYEMLVDNHIDYVVASYYYDPEIQDMDKLHKTCTRLVKNFNETELKGSTSLAYYTLESNAINFCIKDSTNIILTEEESILANETMDSNEIYNLSNSLFMSAIDENFDFFKESTEFFLEKGNSSYFSTFCDACSMAGIDKEAVKEVYDYVKDRSDAEFVTNSCYYMNTYEVENSDFYTQTGAMLALQAMLEASMADNWDIDDDDLDDEDEEKKDNKKEEKKEDRTKVKLTPNTKTSKTTPTTKTTKTVDNTKNSKVNEKKGSKSNPLAALKLNNIKLYIAGLKKNMKDFDSKARTSVRNMDFAVERLIKGIKGALISDRREAIIKGSVIPSFHKCILIAVSLAGLASFNLPLAVVAAVGGFAASKKLTERERALMMDDIEIELELVEKEIQMADSRNQIKKMRELMKMKKNLQREYQRIHYNIRLGKDIVPSGSYLPHNND